MFSSLLSADPFKGADSRPGARPAPVAPSQENKKVEAAASGLEGALENAGQKPGDTAANNGVSAAAANTMAAQTELAKKVEEGELEKDEALLIGLGRTAALMGTMNQVMKNRGGRRSSRTPSISAPQNNSIRLIPKTTVQEPQQDSISDEELRQKFNFSEDFDLTPFKELLKSKNNGDAINISILNQQPVLPENDFSLDDDEGSDSSALVGQNESAEKDTGVQKSSRLQTIESAATTVDTYQSQPNEIDATTQVEENLVGDTAVIDAPPPKRLC